MTVLYTVWCPNGDKDFLMLNLIIPGTKEY